MKKTIEENKYTYAINNRNMLLESHVSMFEYKGLPETINTYFLEYFLQAESMCAIFEDKNGDIITTSCTLASDLDVYGMGKDVIAITRNGDDYRLVRDESCVVGFNNLSMTPCGDIWTDAQALTEIQTSIDFLIFWTRLSPLVRVSDEKLKTQVIDAFKNIKKGIPVTIASKKLLAEYGINDDITVEALTQPDFADKIQYTAKLYEDVLRWHYTRYGHAINGNSKAAQQTVEEIDSTASQAMILPLSMLRERRVMIEKMNAMFSLNASVELSGAWRAEVTAYENQSGEQSIDASADDSTETSGDNESDTLSSADNKESEDINE